MDDRLEKFMEPFLEDETLTCDLTDAQAKVMLDWVQQQIGRAVEKTQDLDQDAAQAALGPRFKRLRARLHQIAKQSASAEDPTTALQQALRWSGLRWPRPNPQQSASTPAAAEEVQ